MTSETGKQLFIVRKMEVNMISLRSGVYFGISTVLMTSPLWIRFIILRSYAPGDNSGSGMDVFSWFFYVMVAFVLLLVLQFWLFLSDVEVPGNSKIIPITCFLVGWLVIMGILLI